MRRHPTPSIPRDTEAQGFPEVYFWKSAKDKTAEELENKTIFC